MKYLLICFLLMTSGKPSSAFIFALIGNINEIFSFIDNMQRLFTGGEEKSDDPEDRLDDVLDKVGEISKKLDQMAGSINQKLEAVMDAISSAEHMRKITKAQDDLAEYINRIDELYDEFLFYANDPEDFDEDTIDEFIGVITSHDNLALGNALNRMYALFVPRRSGRVRESLLELILGIENIKSKFSCDNAMMFQQQILNLYELVIVSEVKGYSIVMFAYSTLSAFDEKPYTKEKNKASKQAILRSMEYLNNTKSAMSKVSRGFIRCEPKTWTRNENFFELEGLYQGFLEEKNKAPCYEVIRTWGDTDNPNLSKRCHGVLDFCTNLGQTATICELGEKSIPRYDYVKDNNGVTYGQSECSGTEKKLESNGRNKCLCECTQENKYSNAVRYVSLLPELSSIDKNMVVTGVRLTNENKKFKMVRLKITQGKLGPYGTIENSSEPNAFLNDGKEFSFGSAETNPKNVFIESENGKEPAQLGENLSLFHFDQRTINLDDVIAPKGHVLTGVKFVHDQSKIPLKNRTNWPQSPLQLAIHVTPFDFKKGKLIPTDKNPSKWITPQDMKDGNYKANRTQVQLSAPTDSTKAPGANKRDSQPNQFIKFQMTDIKKDAGSNSVPFFDMQPVIPISRMPLVGVGIFHKGVPGYGGFITLQAIHLDFSQFLDDNINEKYKELVQQRTQSKPKVKAKDKSKAGSKKPRSRG